MNREGGNGWKPQNSFSYMVMVLNLAAAELAYLGVHMRSAFDHDWVRAYRVL